MRLPRREIIVNVRPDRQAEFAAAFDRWAQAEPVLQGVHVFGTQAKAYLQPVWVVDGPRMGTWHDDRARALAVFRHHVTPDLVESVTFEGRDWHAR